MFPDCGGRGLAGVGNIHCAADLAGHKSINTTKKYAYLKDENRVHAMRRAFLKAGGDA